MKDGLDELRKLMVGKKVIAVEPPCGGDTICQLLFDDGTSFELHATELGFWIVETTPR